MEMISHLKVYNLVDNFQFSEKQNPEQKKNSTRPISQICTQIGEKNNRKL